MARKEVNNDFYETLHEAWYEGEQHPIFLLQRENAVRNPWIAETIQKKIGPKASILDVGCGGGLLTNALAQEGHIVTGVDLSPSSLKTAAQRDITRSVCYREGSAETLPFADKSFDVVCAMDLLEHVKDPGIVIREAARVLKPRGLFFFHTFNRNFLSWLLVIKGVEWCIPNTPEAMHLFSYFIKPKELSRLCNAHGLSVLEMRGLRPTLNRAFVRVALQKKLTPSFQFTFTRSLMTGYSGYATLTNT